MHADIDEEVYIRLERTMADLLVKVNPTKYGPHVVTEARCHMIYLLLHKALYATLQAALLFWRNLSSFLIEELRFKSNLYSSCIANKIINCKQCTAGWHVHDLKILHVDKNIVESIMQQLNDKYGKEEPISVNHGKINDYLGMIIDFSEQGTMSFKIQGYIDQELDEALSNMKGTASTPAANYLYETEHASSLLSVD